MIPYFTQPVWKLGVFTIHAFGIAAAAALVIGYWMVLRRASLMAGLSSVHAGGMYCAVVMSGLIAGSVWNGMSGTRLAMGGGAAVLLLAIATRGWPVLDLFSYAVPVMLTVARVGCFLAHDHLGRRTDSWLGVQFPGGARFDLGLLYAMAAGIAAIVIARLPTQRTGVLTGVMLVSIAGGRAGVLPLGEAMRPFDFWFAVAMVAAGIVIIAVRTRSGAH